MEQLQFDLDRAERLKHIGIAAADAAHPNALKVARKLARLIALNDKEKECNADQVQYALIPYGLFLGQSAGAIFKGPEWEWTGQFIKSERVQNHARLLRVWRYKTS